MQDFSMVKKASDHFGKGLKMSSKTNPQRRYEEYAYVLDFIPHGKSFTVREREGPLVQAIGEEWLTLLEILAMNRATFVVGERICIAREGRTKVVSVLGKLEYKDLTNEAKNELPAVCEKMVRENEKKYVAYFNELQPVTPRLHALELIPGIGKTFMRQILNVREKKPFESFDDIQSRIGFRDPAKQIAKRLVDEISGSARITIFVRK
jgi:putative nucleotide binding protein